jgi:hypothetical protein
MSTQISEILQLSIAERIQLAEDIWDSITAFPDAVPLTNEQNKNLTAACRLMPKPGRRYFLGCAEREDAKARMSYEIIVRPEAAREVQQAFDWYQERPKGLDLNSCARQMLV